MKLGIGWIDYTWDNLFTWRWTIQRIHSQKARTKGLFSDQKPTWGLSDEARERLMAKVLEVYRK